jgi:hypothetical protein
MARHDVFRRISALDGMALSPLEYELLLRCAGNEA